MTPTLAAAQEEAAPQPAAEPRSASDQENAAEEARRSRSGEPQLHLNFSGTPWREVLEWLAEEANLSLQVETMPSGTFSYSDLNRTYTPSEAIDAMNLVLMREGYAMIRRHQLLVLVDLEDNLARDYLRELAEVIAPAELDERANTDFVRVTFPLGGLTPEAAIEDLEKLRSPAGSVVVLSATRSVVAADTVGVLKSIRDVLRGAEGFEDGVLEISLRHRSADEILEVARPHLGLEPGVDAGEGISVSTNLLGDRIYATGDATKLRLLKGLVEKTDLPLPASETGTVVAELPELRSYDTGTADATVALEVLQRLLAGLPDVRLALEPSTQAIIALARPSEHQTIQKTLSELRGQQATLEVIQLRRMDPQAALLTINKYFGSTADSPQGPTVDGDPVSNKLWIKGTAEEIAQVRQLIEQMEESSNSSLLGDRVRVLPYTGRTAEEAISQLEALWRMSGRKNRIRMMTTGGSESGRDSLPQRRLNAAPASPEAPERSLPPQRSRLPAPQAPAQPQAPTQPQAPAAPQSAPEAAPGSPAESRQPPPDRSAATGQGWFRLASDESPAATASQASGPQEAPEARAEATSPSDVELASEDAEDESASGLGSDIIIQMTPQGLIVASDDPEALAEFEQLFATLAGQAAGAGGQPTVYWLKYIKATVAADLLNSILSGAESAGGGVGDMAGSMLDELGGGMLGGLLGLGGGGGGDGPVLTTTGSVSIVPDARLNALVIQANAIDMQLIEDVLQVIDREESPEDVRTTPQPALIPVIYQDANEVATIVKGVYAERIPAAGGGNNRQPSPQDLINALRGRGGRGGGASQNEDNKPAPITVTVDTRSNSLIVAAPPQDFADIRNLVEALDQQNADSEESVQVVTLGGNLKPELVQNALSAILGSQAKTATTESSSSSSNGSRGSSSEASAQPSASDIQQRIEFFRSLRERGGFGGDRGGDGGRSFGGRGGGERGGQRGGGDGGRGGFGGGGRGGR
ncbi:secretin N-terminal domain-containing protein [Candidatus Laterigemmans baculatus]|uniref:secretin N-terminal domain-containing protein n=1 Tax=Candidatus Laterigemmans baculatus TaxID=2770505 RepID=UPI0013D94C4E|nr:secretin N-terminal domain-containing protein [Candidatus Laterigemmans baculatus]